jgi:hypothetical protein
MSITYAERVFVALVIQHPMRMNRIIMSCVCPALSYFSTLSHKRHDFRENIMNIKCVLMFLYNFCLKNPKKNLARYYHKIT